VSDTQLFARESRSLCVAFELILCVRTHTDFSFNTLAPHITETLVFTGWSPQSRLRFSAWHSILAGRLTAYSEVTSCLTTRNWLTLSGEISTGKSACVQVSGTELDWLVGMSYARFRGLNRRPDPNPGFISPCYRQLNRRVARDANHVRSGYRHLIRSYQNTAWPVDKSLILGRPADLLPTLPCGAGGSIAETLPWISTGPNSKINPKSLSTLPKNRTTLELRTHIPASPQRDGAVRRSTEPRVPCRRNQLTESTSAEGAFRAKPASFLGHRRLLIADKTDTTLSSPCSFAQLGVGRVSR
jgi:hypothetical protein